MNTKTRSIDDIIREINDAGWQVCTFSQISNGAWMAAVRKPGFFMSGFAQASTPLEAITSAWRNRKEPIPDRMPVATARDFMAAPKKTPRVRIDVDRASSRGRRGE